MADPTPDQPEQGCPNPRCEHDQIVHPPSALDASVGESRRLHTPCPDCNPNPLHQRIEGQDRGDTHEQQPKLIQAHICMECGAVWDRPTRCPFNGADSPTVPADQVAADLLAMRGRIEGLIAEFEYEAKQVGAGRGNIAMGLENAASRLRSVLKGEGDG